MYVCKRDFIMEIPGCSEVTGTRSWSGLTNSARINPNDVVYVRADYFNKSGNETQYTDQLPFKENSLLKGVVLSVYSNTLRVKFFIDNAVSSINKSYALTEECLSIPQKQFILPQSLDDEESALSDDSVQDPAYTPPKQCLQVDLGEIEASEKTEVFLCENGCRLFKATLDEANEQGTVHGVQIEANQGRYFITQVLEEAHSWDKFNENVL